MRLVVRWWGPAAGCGKRRSCGRRYVESETVLAELAALRAAHRLDYVEVFEGASGKCVATLTAYGGWSWR